MANTAYRFVAAAAAGYPAATSNVVRVDIWPILTFSASRKKLRHGSRDSFSLSSDPLLNGAYVRLQQRVHGHWQTVRRARLSATGQHIFTMRFARAGTKRLRATEPATRRHLAAAGRPFLVIVS